jgi:hypothetical protein
MPAAVESEPVSPQGRVSPNTEGDSNTRAANESGSPGAKTLTAV